MGLIQKKTSEHSNSFPLTMTPLSAHWYPDRLTHTTPQSHCEDPALHSKDLGDVRVLLLQHNAAGLFEAGLARHPGDGSLGETLAHRHQHTEAHAEANHALRAHHLLQGLPDIFPCPKNKCGQHKHLNRTLRCLKPKMSPTTTSKSKQKTLWGLWNWNAPINPTPVLMQMAGRFLWMDLPA